MPKGKEKVQFAHVKKKPGAVAKNTGYKPSGDGASPEIKKTPKDRAGQKSAASSWMSAGAMREMVESVVIAFVLAFLFRTFEAEAFVIPTGSMAPTLMGRHRDLYCPKCGYHFQVNASSEVDARTGASTGREVVAGTCPMCRYTVDLAPGNPHGEEYTPFKGDRILVAKYPYQFGDPKRWDVAVFKYPGGAMTNYIKRICGVPKETIYIRHGNLFSTPDGQTEKAILRKPPEKIVAMMQPVWDNDYVLPGLVERGLPARWGAVRGESRGADGWKASDDLRSFHANGNAGGEVWLNYRHGVPTFNQWQALQKGESLPAGAVRSQLITDFTPYNTEQERNYSSSRTWGESEEFSGRTRPPIPQKLGLHWVSDLVLECSVDVEQANGQYLMTLVQGGMLFRCEIDLATGKAALAIDGVPEFHPTATTKLRGPGKHDVRFANVDDQLVLWIDGSVVQFDAATMFGPLDTSRPQGDDLQPARIGSRKAAVRVSHIRLYRDIYYIAQRATRSSASEPLDDYPRYAGQFPNFSASEDTEERLAEFFSNPREWDVLNSRREVNFHLEDGQFLALGDNSAESMDSRLWESRCPQFYVTRDLLVGKALFIYWPHSWDKIPGTDGLPMMRHGVWFPFFPNFARMGFVR